MREKKYIKIIDVLISWVPVYADENQRLSCMSIGFLLTNKNDSVVWRGPKKNGTICNYGRPWNILLIHFVSHD